MSEIQVRIPRLHSGQANVLKTSSRFNGLACGRRWGKSTLLQYLMVRCALEGKRYGYFAPTYKLLSEVFSEVKGRVGKAGAPNKTEKRIDFITGGSIEFWTLEDENAGRSRKYHQVGIDEAGLVKGLEAIWNEAISPTLFDYEGGGWLVGTPKGKNFFHQAFVMGQDPHETDWSSWQAPTTDNPFIKVSEVERYAAKMPERVYQQEILAEFIDDAGGVFRGVDAVVSGEPFEPVAPFYIGVDLARVEDFTVITVVDSNKRQVYLERFNQINWDRQIERILSVYGAYTGATIWLDSTGVGDPIYERLRKAGASIEGYRFTSGSKEALIDNLAIVIENGECRLKPDPVQTNELKAYEYTINPRTRNVSMGAPSGLHDDTVIALALAMWGANRPRRQWVVR